MRLLLVLLLAALLVLPRHHVTGSQPRDLRSPGSGKLLAGDIDRYLSELKDFYTKIGRPRYLFGLETCSQLGTRVFGTLTWFWRYVTSSFAYDTDVVVSKL